MHSFGRLRTGSLFVPRCTRRAIGRSKYSILLVTLRPCASINLEIPSKYSFRGGVRRSFPHLGLLVNYSWDEHLPLGASNQQFGVRTAVIRGARDRSLPFFSYLDKHRRSRYPSSHRKFQRDSSNIITVLARFSWSFNTIDRPQKCLSSSVTYRKAVPGDGVEPFVLFYSLGRFKIWDAMLKF